MYRFICLLSLMVIIFSSCRIEEPEPEPEPDTGYDFSGKLTAEEIQKGRLSPEILWKFSRLGDARISPGENHVIYQVTRFDHIHNESITLSKI